MKSGWSIMHTKPHSLLFYACDMVRVMRLDGKLQCWILNSTRNGRKGLRVYAHALNLKLPHITY